MNPLVHPPPDWYTHIVRRGLGRGGPSPALTPLPDSWGWGWGWGWLPSLTRRGGVSYPIQPVGKGLEEGLPRLFSLPVDWVLLAQHGCDRPLEV